MIIIQESSHFYESSQSKLTLAGFTNACVVTDGLDHVLWHIKWFDTHVQCFSLY
jgi:hypothetical protein